MRKNSRFYPAPGYTLYRELLPRLDLEAFEKALNGWLGQHRGQLPSTLAFDGKCIRENLGAIVTLLDVEEGVPIAVAATTVGKGGEVACARKLLHSDQVALENATLIADSLHTNARTPDRIGPGRQLHCGDQRQPANSPSIGPGTISRYFPPFSSLEPANGFLTQRQTRVMPIEADAAAYPHAAQLISVTREVTHKASGKIEQGCRYFATSLRPHDAGPERLSHQIRGYWGVENIVHWRRDVLCREDSVAYATPTPPASCALAHRSHHFGALLRLRFTQSRPRDLRS